MFLLFGVVKFLRDVFICKICYVIFMMFLVIVIKCCNILFGCEECVNVWFDGVDGFSKKCLYCNEFRGYVFIF